MKETREISEELLWIRNGIPNVSILGTVGSRAYGLNTEDSDWDFKGVFIEYSDKLWGLNKVKDLYEVKKERIGFDCVMYEIGKFFSLCMKSNPTVLEMLFLDMYILTNNVGNKIIDNRSKFLSTTNVINAYSGYAMSQLMYLKRNHKFQNNRNIEKHIRHCFRLFDQGISLLKTGKIEVKLSEPEKYFELGKLSEDEVTKIFEEKDKEIHSITSVLQDEPDFEYLNEMLIDIRREYITTC